MARAKLTVRRTFYNDNNGNAVAEPGRGNKRTTRQRSRHFKMKKLLLQTKAIQVKKKIGEPLEQ